VLWCTNAELQYTIASSRFVEGNTSVTCPTGYKVCLANCYFSRTQTQRIQTVGNTDICNVKEQNEGEKLSSGVVTKRPKAHSHLRFVFFLLKVLKPFFCNFEFSFYDAIFFIRSLFVEGPLVQRRRGLKSRRGRNFQFSTDICKVLTDNIMGDTILQAQTILILPHNSTNQHFQPQILY